MLEYAVKRICVSIAVLLAISVIVFTLTNMAQDPALAIAGPGASTEDVRAVRQAYGLDRPIWRRYAVWLGDALQGNLGDSYRQKRSAMAIIAERLPTTLTLSLLSLTLALIVSLALGLASAAFPRSAIDHFSLWFALVSQAMPSFWLALLLISIFSVSLGWLPAAGSQSYRHFIMPTLVLAVYILPAFLRLIRSGLMDVMSADYIRTARAKGLRASMVVGKHAMRNAAAPIVSLAAVQLGYLLGGSVVTETIFAMNGVGYLAWESIAQSDLPVIQAIVLVTGFFYVLLTLAADLINSLIDRRIRLA